jgi:hypothetical protein
MRALPSSGPSVTHDSALPSVLAGRLRLEPPGRRVNGERLLLAVALASPGRAGRN